MKYPLFEPLGDQYPTALEQHYERIIKKIVELWDDPEIDDYFTSLIVDTRGGRQGFAADVFKDIHTLYKFKELERLRKAKNRRDAIRELQVRGIEFRPGAFLKAIQDGDQRLVDLFIQAGINVHTNDETGCPAIMIALKGGYTVIANILLTAGANPNAHDALGFTPLLMACGKAAQGYRGIAEKLIRLGADVNACDRLGWTPLMLAISGGAAEVAELLLQYGANPGLRTRKGENAMILAQKLGQDKLIDLLSAKQSGNSNSLIFKDNPRLRLQ
ncbi:ankyrin repeat domain-containing protein [Candidatus Methylobacter oryzae]|uniref:Ankyrin repeat domain-containing protein n=2 Tax=Candidatus Methylobacter oryzae TaxID=2497749 RepID=A0ABY3CAF8_9GAMM|nr:ankyrin repeat domain-containing protein [Candidatus Methylobacter oryzae]